MRLARGAAVRVFHGGSGVPHNGSMHASLEPLGRDLQRIFGARFLSLVAYGDPEGDADGVHTLALLERVDFEDLTACARLVAGWRRAGLAAPLLLSREEFVRTLDVFPLEYGGILARHVVIAGSDPFAGMRIEEADLRRACEHQAKSHLIHLREGYLEAGGEGRTVARMMAASAPALHALVSNVERLDPGAAGRAGVTEDLLRAIAGAAEHTIAEPSALLARYVEAVERLWREVDGWKS
jgi:hypothetical protein